ncbi:MAG TPA: hypothetical protein VM529_02480 [Gemmata sp.]|nr:hypothetical protein [Gemmata sp.]
MRLDRPGGIEPGHHPTRGVVDHRDQHHLLATAFEPVVDRGVHLHQLAEATASGTPAAVRVAVAAFPQPLGQEPAAERLDTDAEAFGGQFLASQCGTEVGVACPVGLENLPAEVGLVAVVGRLAPQSVDQ